MRSQDGTMTPEPILHPSTHGTTPDHAGWWRSASIGTKDHPDLMPLSTCGKVRIGWAVVPPWIFETIRMQCLQVLGTSLSGGSDNSPHSSGCQSSFIACLW